MKGRLGVSVHLLRRITTHTTASLCLCLSLSSLPFLALFSHLFKECGIVHPLDPLPTRRQVIELIMLCNRGEVKEDRGEVNETPMKSASVKIASVKIATP